MSDVDELRVRLERAAEGLVYSSESDRPFEFVELAAPERWPLSPAEFAAHVGQPGAPAGERDIEEFFRRHIEGVHPSDSASVALVARYDSLKRLIETELRDVRVYRIGRVQIECFVVGVDADRLVGFRTIAVET